MSDQPRPLLILAALASSVPPGAALPAGVLPGACPGCAAGGPGERASLDREARRLDPGL